MIEGRSAGEDRTSLSRAAETATFGSYGAVIHRKSDQ